MYSHVDFILAFVVVVVVVFVKLQFHGEKVVFTFIVVLFFKERLLLSSVYSKTEHAWMCRHFHTRANTAWRSHRKERFQRARTKISFCSTDVCSFLPQCSFAAWTLGLDFGHEAEPRRPEACHPSLLSTGMIHDTSFDKPPHIPLPISLEKIVFHAKQLSCKAAGTWGCLF